MSSEPASFTASAASVAASPTAVAASEAASPTAAAASDAVSAALSMAEGPSAGAASLEAPSAGAISPAAGAMPSPSGAAPLSIIFMPKKITPAITMTAIMSFTVLDIAIPLPQNSLAGFGFGSLVADWLLTSRAFDPTGMHRLPGESGATCADARATAPCCHAQSCSNFAISLTLDV